MISLKDLEGKGVLSSFERAIKEDDLPEIVRLLKHPLLNLSHENRLKLAACLDPDNPKPKKTGSKPRFTRNLAMRNFVIATEYRHLCRNLEFARYILNLHREEFNLVDGAPLTDENGEFAPVWKYPERERSRNAISLPSCKEIQEYLSDLRGIEAQTLQKIITKTNKK